ncbi:dihydrofolate reductase [Agromyces archimandritae]|uniref:dihydrofolate reductase n=1 Tax=Agromyces archimandritae TaxID=2781962 RepID=A0A975INW8_9MICO|nr:dihydrofolate reductase [Agromyces archimandritae]QTX05033.1 dihydrofolate reductase [Agromyces archimandritae]
MTGEGRPRIGLIWAQTADRIIGAGGRMPWHVPEDLAHFKELTLGAPVVMGRKTWESLSPRFRPLPGRRNIVVTRDPAWSAAGAEHAASIDAALALAGSGSAKPGGTDTDAAGPGAADTAEGSSAPAVWVIGGGEVYRQAIGRADVVEVTELDLEVAGDTRAPELDASWREIALDPADGWLTSRTGIRYRFRTFTRGRTVAG